jgi:enoyl-CoA hydratase/carnithine racemase
MATQSARVDKDTRDFKTIKVEVSGPLGRLVLNRPERLNAIGATMLQELAEAARWFDIHRELRVVIVSGAGRAFSVGADLRDSPTGTANPDASWLYRREVGQYGLRAADAIEQMHAVTIAQVQGYAVGGGLVLMALCDLRIAADDAVFFIPEIDLGVPLAWGGIPRLVREIGPALTKELVMTCRRFTPAEAKAAGFLNRVVPANQLEREVDELAAQLVAKPSVPVIITKEHVNAVTRAMSAGITSFADGDLLLASIGESESEEAARNYTKKALGIEGKL